MDELDRVLAEIKDDRGISPPDRPPDVIVVLIGEEQWRLYPDDVIRDAREPHGVIRFASVPNHMAHGGGITFMAETVWHDTDLGIVEDEEAPKVTREHILRADGVYEIWTDGDV